MRRPGTRLTATTLALCLALAALAGLAGCGEDTAEEPSALDPVRGFLETRSVRATDAAAYEPYLLDPEVASQFAQAAAAEAEATLPPTPGWREPYLAESGDDQATVVVLWVPSEDFPGWPTGVQLTVVKEGESWLISDAADIIEEADVPEPLAD